MSLRYTVAELIRKRRGPWAQLDKFAEVIGCSEATLKSIINQPAANPQTMTDALRDKFMAFFNVKAEELITLDGMKHELARSAGVTLETLDEVLYSHRYKMYLAEMEARKRVKQPQIIVLDNGVLFGIGDPQ